MEQCRFAHAILIVDGKYALQLRDDKPGIAAPGMWSLFGGAVRPDEQPRDTVLREVSEELTLTLSSIRFFYETEFFNQWVFSMATYSFFEADCGNLWTYHDLREGLAAKTFTFEELRPLRMPDLMRTVLAMHHLRAADGGTALFAR